MIPAIASLPALGSSSAASSTGAASSTSGAATSSSGTSSAGSDFGSVIADALENVQSAQNTASSEAASAAAGDGNIADAMIATTQASVETQVATAVVNKAVDAFQTIMDMTF